MKPYPPSKTVTVCKALSPVNYTNEKGEDRTYLVAGATDGEVPYKLVIYDTAKFPLIQDQSTVVLRNFILKDDHTIVITKLSKVYRTSNVQVKDAASETARQLVQPRPSPIVTCAEAKRSPSKQRVSVRGKVIQNEEARVVQVGRTPTKIKSVMIQDHSGNVKVTLWRDNAKDDIRNGDFLIVKEVVMKAYQDEIHMSTTHLSNVEKIDPPKETIKTTFIAYTLEGDFATLLTETDEEYQISMEKLGNIEDFTFPIRAQCVVEGNKCLEIVTLD